MDRGFGDDGGVADMPWASVFSPTANARALSAIQAEGFRAASKIVDQFVRIVEASDGPSANGAQPAPANGGNGASVGNGELDLEKMTRAWWSMFGQLLLRSAPMSNPVSGGGGKLDLANSDAAGQILIEAAEPGWAGAEVWLHNNSHEDLGVANLRCSELIAHNGHVIASGAVEFEPAAVPVPARSSRGVAMRVHVAPFDPPGLYRGTLLLDGHPDLWLPVVVTVRAPIS